MVASGGLALLTLGLAALPQSQEASADVCGSVGGRHVSVNACGNVADAIAPGFRPCGVRAAAGGLRSGSSSTASTPPPPNVSVCANVGRRISVSGCV